ncbi:MAG: alginate lyase family protein [Abitibacteriaceae bacterium]|nr:alginate lyase family protein [Abditibacteriaceae bacterium]
MNCQKAKAAASLLCAFAIAVLPVRAQQAAPPNLATATRQIASQTAFVHPGGLHNQADLDRMKAKVAAGAHPWIDDWHKLISDPLAQDTYRPNPQANMGVSRQRASRDAHAAYLNALRWYISGDARYADCAIRICNDWSAKVNQVPTGTDIPGLSGIPIAEFALVGELLRICPRWQADDCARFKHMMLTYWYPVAHDFLTRHNNQSNTHYWANWDIANVGALIAIGVLCDNRAIFDEGVAYFKNGAGTGSIQHAVYFLHPGGLGQWQESGRDQEHAQLGVGMMAQLCEVAWKQGVDLYGYDNNRLLAGAEYVAQWNLWQPVPYKYYTNSARANQSWPSVNGRGRLDRPIWELLYNHYVVRRGLRAPHTQAMVELMRLEGGSIDHFGYGTLTFTLDAAKSPYPPAPIPPTPTQLTATAGVGRVFLNWTRRGDTAQGYEVQRATRQDGPFVSIAAWADSTRCEYIDTNVTPGTTYFYGVAAQNQAGKSDASNPASATPASLSAVPPGWTQTSIGPVQGATAGFAPVSGRTFVVGGSGTGIGGSSDGLCFVGRSVTGDATLTARLADVNWNRGGRLAKVGIMMRASLATDAPTLVMKLGDVGARQAGFGTRAAPGDTMTWVGGNDYTWLPAWFRLERLGNVFTALESSDGAQWFRVGTSTVPMGNTYFIGLAVSANSDNANTTYFDHVAVQNNEPGPEGSRG